MSTNASQWSAVSSQQYSTVSFVTQVTSGSESVSFCDNGNLNASQVTNASGNWNNASNAGTFYLNVNNATSNSNANIGTQIVKNNSIRYLKCIFVQ